MVVRRVSSFPTRGAPMPQMARPAWGKGYIVSSITFKAALRLEQGSGRPPRLGGFLEEGAVLVETADLHRARASPRRRKRMAATARIRARSTSRGRRGRRTAAASRLARSCSRTRTSRTRRKVGMCARPEPMRAHDHSPALAADRAPTRRPWVSRRRGLCRRLGRHRGMHSGSGWPGSGRSSRSLRACCRRSPSPSASASRRRRGS